MAPTYLATERLTGGIRTIETDHAYIHEGQGFYISDPRSINGTYKYQITTPKSTASNFQYIHFRPANLGVESAKLVVRFQEGPVSSDITGGAAVTAINRNRNSTKTASVVFKAGVTATTVGTDIESFTIFGGTGPGQTAIGTGKAEPMEWVLKPGQDYVMNLTTTAALNVSANFFWYEIPKGV